MSKIVIAASASLQSDISSWKDYWESKGHRVIDYPKPLPPETFDLVYPDCYKDFFANLLKSDILFILNQDRKGVAGYIGAETFAEIGFAVANNVLNKTNIKIILYKKGRVIFRRGITAANLIAN
jgi:hypothetical protein